MLGRKLMRNRVVKIEKKIHTELYKGKCDKCEKLISQKKDFCLPVIRRIIWYEILNID
jgi:hypothetical protein